MSMPYNVAQLSAANPQFFSVQPLTTLRSVVENGNLPSLGAILAGPEMQAVGVRAHDVERAGRSLPPPSLDTVGHHVVLPVSPRTLASFASSRPGTPGAKHFERHQLAVLCLSMESLKGCGRKLLYHASSLLRSADSVSEDPAVLQGAAWDLISRHHIKREGADPERLRHYDAGALVRDDLPIRAVQAIACAGPESEAEVKRWALPEHIEVIRRPAYFW